MTKPKPSKSQVWFEAWARARSPQPWPEPQVRKGDPQEAADIFEKPLAPFTLSEAKQIFRMGGAAPDLRKIQTFRADLNIAYSEWVATARLDSRAIQAKPLSDRRSRDRGGSARHRFIWIMLADIFKRYFGGNVSASVSNRSGTRGKPEGAFVAFVQTVMKARGHEIGAHAIRELQRETTRRVKDAPKRRAALIKRRKRPQNGI
jgi:hypothetical protein